MPLRYLLFILSSMGFSSFVYAHGELTAKNLSQYKIPVTPGLLDGKSPIIVDNAAAIQLGKALFWDTNVGSNGVACGTCHFHAGADSRTTNQLNPGMLHLANPVSSQKFELASHKGEPNYNLTANDFPFFKFSNVDDRNSNIVFQTDDVVGSSGVYKQTFTAIDPNRLDEDVCTPTDDPIHKVGSLETRQTTKRNAPTVINAVFNHRNFWDGRANNEFNGVSSFGPRDVNAKIWVIKNGKAVAQKISLKNASLASQAVGPPTDMIEMSCSGRAFNDIAKKLLTQKPLANQEVHPEDSVLAQLRDQSGLGLSSTYESLIKKAFNTIYWKQTGPVQKGKSDTQLEANFSFFFGLAIQSYESTLLSNQSKFDIGVASMQEEDTVPPNFTAAEKKGLAIFSDVHCDTCHAGPAFSTATNLEIYSANAYKTGNAYVDRIGFVPANSDDSVDVTFADRGFFNTSVVPNNYDAGLGGVDPWGNPLSYAEQYINSIKPKPKKFIDNFIVSACDFTNPFISDFKPSELIASQDKIGCASLPKSYVTRPKQLVVQNELASADQGRLSTLAEGAFKVPMLRDIELTGPYMHNGGMKSLEEVVEFYNRGGNVYNRRHAATLVFPQGFNQEDKDALVAFLKTLTDERVRWEKAPFDHPSIQVSNGHKNSGSGGLMDDKVLQIPAVGKNGLSEPLKSFENTLTH